MTEAEAAIARWDLCARELMGQYTDDGDAHRSVTLNPALFNLLGEVRGQTILDAGCGEGYLSRMLAHQGANVTGVDFSATMLEMAESRTSPELDVCYYHGNCESLPFLQAAKFDVVVSNMVIQDLPDYKSAIAEAYRLIKPGGAYIFSILHPCFVAPVGEWVKEGGQKQYWKVDRYFDGGRFEQRSLYKTFFYHRTLSSYVTTILQNGFKLEALVEPSPNLDKLQQYPRLEDGLRIPDFLIFKARKLL